MARVKKSDLRRCAAAVLTKKGFTVKARSGQGIVPGGRLSITEDDGKPLDVAVRTSFERALSFSRQSDDVWRTLTAVDRILAVVPDKSNSKNFEIFLFNSDVVSSFFNRALKSIKGSDRSPSLEVPIFVPLDKDPRKNFGHKVSALGEKALWSFIVTADDLKALPPDASSETFMERVKREFAEINDVDVSKVVVEFRIIS